MKKLIATLALIAPAATLAGAGDHDVGIAGVDYEKLIDPVEINITRDNRAVRKNCGQGTLGCAITKKRVFRYDDTNEISRIEYVCDVYLKTRTDEITERHEMKHCYGWAHAEMPKMVQRQNYAAQRSWLDRNHKIWFPTDYSGK